MDGLCAFASFLVVLILSCRVFGFRKTQEACNAPLGLQNGQVPDSNLRASSYYNLYTGSAHLDMKPKYCRLNHKYAWCTNRGKRVRSWLMVDLGRLTNVTGIATQGYAGVSDYYVKSFKLAYSINGSSWTFVGRAGTDMVFVGNKHGLDIKNNSFDKIQARYIKVFPINFYIRICLRMELYGCVQGSSIPTTHTTTTLTTPLIATSRITSSTKNTPTTTTITPASNAMKTSTTTKATSIKTAVSSSVSPSTSSISSSTATSSYTTGIPSYEHTTTVPPPPSLPPTSLRPSREASTVAMTTFKHSDRATSLATLDAMHQKSVGENEKKDFIIAGFSIFGGLVLFVIIPFSIFFIIRRRKKMYNNVHSCQLVDLPEYPCNGLADCNESFAPSFVTLENGDDSTLIEV